MGAYIISVTMKSTHCIQAMMFYQRSRSLDNHLRVQPTVTFPIGGDVNVLHDYMKT